MRCDFWGYFEIWGDLVAQCPTIPLWYMYMGGMALCYQITSDFEIITAILWGYFWGYFEIWGDLVAQCPTIPFWYMYMGGMGGHCATKSPQISKYLHNSSLHCDIVRLFLRLFRNLRWFGSTMPHNSFLVHVHGGHGGALCYQITSDYFEIWGDLVAQCPPIPFWYMHSLHCDIVRLFLRLFRNLRWFGSTMPHNSFLVHVHGGHGGALCYQITSDFEIISKSEVIW